MESSLFNNTDNATMGVGLWFIQQLSRSLLVYTVRTTIINHGSSSQAEERQPTLIRPFTGNSLQYIHFEFATIIRGCKNL